MPAFEIEILTKQEADAIWKARGKRADDFQEYVEFLNLLDVGGSARLKVPKQPLEKNAEEAQKLKYNFNEAAKERVRAYSSDVDPASVPEAELTVTPVSEWKQADDGKWYAHKGEPVLLRWKVESHLEKVTVTENGKKGQVEKKIIDNLTLLVIATDSVRKRGPRAKKPKTEETAPEASTNGTDGTTPLDDVKPADGAPEGTPAETPATT